MNENDLCKKCAQIKREFVFMKHRTGSKRLSFGKDADLIQIPNNLNIVRLKNAETKQRLNLAKHVTQASHLFWKS